MEPPSAPAAAWMCLVTTDVLARGIDVLAINIVINYDAREGEFMREH